MTLSVDDACDAIARHSAGLAEAARAAGLPAPVDHCPGWSVADLVGHVHDVQWFWRTIAGERRAAPPGDAERPVRPADGDLLDAFHAGTDDLVTTLRTADQEAACWTWYPPQQRVGFVTRHQVQEAAVHHWDAAHAAGRTIVIDPHVAGDAVDEFLTVSLADGDDAVRLGQPLDGDVVLHATDTDGWWTVRQDAPDTALVVHAEPGRPTVEASAADLLLWLYRRVPLPEADAALVARFRVLSDTS